MQNKLDYPYFFDAITLEEPLPFFCRSLHRHPDWEIVRLHIHQVPEIGCCLRGDGIFIIGGKTYTFKAGDCVVITPHEPHFAQSMLGTSSEWRWLYFDPERALFPAFGQLELSNFSHFYGENFHNLFSPSQQPELCRIIGRLIAVADNRDEPFRQPHILALLALFTIELHKIQATGRRYDNANTTLHQLSRVNLAVQYLVNHFREKVEIAKLAALCGLSPTHFRRVFLQATSKTPLDYLQHLRITMAMAELRSQGRYSISETALRCGYDSISSFNRQFKRITGQQPRQWQKEQQQTAEQKDRQFPPFILDKANQ
ncbi:AraC family transcriptional regulator [Victivallis sp. Marseille-Q1083]|uniref:AraC family transcriptional regulator n=1 Tax=Victivallis sp. Marseille-Q1083 TaxID=2717288 RepID=UPI00158AD936|nr:AraC family transcriptional regulator [Victivallis sp. Marseille-Q1083]